MRVLHIVNAWGTGGVERNILNYCEYLPSKDFKFDVYARVLLSHGFDDIAKKYGIKFFVEKKGEGIARYTKKFNFLDSIVDEYGYEIIHINAGMGDSFFYLHHIRKKFPDKKVLIHCHATDLGKESKIKMKILDKVGKNFFSKGADCYLACSQDAGQWLYNKRIIGSSKYKVLYYSINTDKFVFNLDKRENIRNMLGISGKYIIGTVGRLAYQKNPFYLLKIFKEIHDEIENSVLLWIGEGPLKGEIVKEIKKYGLENSVILFGTSNEVQNLMSAMDVFLLPSFYEGLALVSIEAQANGLHCFMSSTITVETNVTDLAHYLDINISCLRWAQEICKFKDQMTLRSSERFSSLQYIEEIKKRGFDGKENAKKIGDLYEKIRRN